MPTQHQRAAILEHRQVLSPGSRADEVLDHVDPAAAGEALHLGGEVLALVVDPQVGAELPQRASFSSEPAVATIVAPTSRASWMQAVPTPEAAAWISTVWPAARPPSSKRVVSAV